MPLTLKKDAVSYGALKKIFKDYVPDVPVFLERAIPMAMGSKGAFSYGRGYEKILCALIEAGYSEHRIGIIEPATWARRIHEGISKDLKPKAKSLIAVRRLFPESILKQLPRNRKGELLDGPVDALLIAAYGFLQIHEGKVYSQSTVEAQEASSALSSLVGVPPVTPEPEGRRISQPDARLNDASFQGVKPEIDLKNVISVTFPADLKPEKEPTAAEIKADIKRILFERREAEKAEDVGDFL
jgi:hypothetical protein